ncbi:MAG: ABC transporter substrate-binding protein [Dehalococcoidia bacterium]|nr:ABC transporter substrate-binding protein [Dehalococcoidia bacterium]
MRICSLLPAATEMVYLLGIEDDLVGVTHECDYPEAARSKPSVTATAVRQEGVDGRAIDRQVGGLLHEHRSIYQLDLELIQRLQPDLILTQEICDVCAVSREQVEEAAQQLYGTANVISLDPAILDDVIADIARLGEIAGREEEGRRQATLLSRRVDAVRQSLPHGRQRPRVAFLEWLQPPLVAGHWIPQMVALAGGYDVFATGGQPSRRIEWEELRTADPELIFVAPCGFDLARAAGEYERTALPEWWGELKAVRDGRLFVIDGNAYTSRPGPRLVDGLEILATVIRGAGLTSTRYGRDYARL